MALASELSYSFADTLNWENEEQIELIDGEISLMATPLRVHQEILSALFLQIANYLSGKQCRVYPAPFAVRPFEKEGDAPEDVDTMLEPDITVVCDPAKLDKYGCKGAPDMVIEILSPSTRRKDLRIKYQIYQRAGVQEYWIVDPDIKIVQVFQLENGVYNAPDLYTAVSTVPVGLWDDFSIDLNPVFAVN
ncbi:MAG: Uma2 family endonuclease [Oscillospiraceae bacterium]|nr:Uma2 family endonuclease [Oscillospiraceae bacterium]